MAGFLGHFEHGVASGDPFSDSIVLWTRATPASAVGTAVPASTALNLTWRVWREDLPLSTEREGYVVTDGGRDWTAKPIVSVLAHSTRYRFQFFLGSAQSPVGRFRLPPPPGQRLEHLRYGVFSCSSWPWGYFNAFRAAVSHDLDFWLHLGDWLYEDGWENGYPRAEQAVRWAGLSTEMITLSDMRQRHALHRLDEDAQALSASSPLIAIWDDHEFFNDAWAGGSKEYRPDGANGDTLGSWWVHKRAAVKAYHEWMPTRTAPPEACQPDPTTPLATPAEVAACTGKHEGEHIYRQFRFGDLAALYVLESRVLARSEQGVDDASLTHSDAISEILSGQPPGAWHTNGSVHRALLELNASWDAIRHEEGREMLGGTQLGWLEEAIVNASADDVRWHLLGQQIMISPRHPPDIEGAIHAASGTADGARWREMLDNITSANYAANTIPWHDMAAWAASWMGQPRPVTIAIRAEAMRMLAASDLQLNSDFDGWDGYPEARGRLLEVLAKVPHARLGAYGGDSHAAWAGRLRSAEGDAVIGLEFDATSVTSSGMDTWIAAAPPQLLAAGYLHANPSTLTYANMDRRGWLHVELTPEAHHVHFMSISTVGDRTSYEVTCDASFVQQADSAHEMSRAPCTAPRGDDSPIGPSTSPSTSGGETARGGSPEYEGAGGEEGTASGWLDGEKDGKQELKKTDGEGTALVAVVSAGLGTLLGIGLTLVAMRHLGYWSPPKRKAVQLLSTDIPDSSSSAGTVEMTTSSMAH